MRMSTIKLNTDCKCLRHLASNAGPLHENYQSNSAQYCSHMINVIIYHHYQRKANLNPMQGNPNKSWILNSKQCIPDSRYWIPLRFLVSGIQSSAGFRIPRVNFWIPKPRISHSVNQFRRAQQFQKQKIPGLKSDCLTKAVGMVQ